MSERHGRITSEGNFETDHEGNRTSFGDASLLQMQRKAEGLRRASRDSRRAATFWGSVAVFSALMAEVMVSDPDRLTNATKGAVVYGVLASAASAGLTINRIMNASSLSSEAQALESGLAIIQAQSNVAGPVQIPGAQ